MLAGTRSLDSRVQSQQIRLFGKVINHLDDFADVIRSLPEHVYDFAGRLNRRINFV